MTDAEHRRTILTAICRFNAHCVWTITTSSTSELDTAWKQHAEFHWRERSTASA